MNAQAHDRDAERRLGLPGPAGDTEAIAVARQVLATYLGTEPVGLAARLAEWAAQHIAAAQAGVDRTRWQWEITMLAWLCEECGLPDLLPRVPAAAENLLAEAGFAARALRQAPFTG